MSTSATPTLQLYGAQTGNCWRAAIALEEARITYRPRWVDLRGGEHYKAAFRELNPVGKVPVLVEESGADSFVLSQSNAIVFFAAQKAPGLLLPTQDVHELAQIYERYFYFVTDVIAVNHAAFFLRGHPDPIPARALNTRVLEALVKAESFVSKTTYMAGDKFSIADIAAVTITASVAEQLDWEQLPHLKRWFFEVLARPSVARGMSVFVQRQPAESVA